MSEPQPDGSAHALAIIAFVGSVFSPYYAWQRRLRGDVQAPAERHCALNVSLYRRPPGGARYARLWSMTERGAGQLSRSAERLQIGRSALSWPGSALQIDIDEWTAPWPQRLRGRLTLQPQALPGRAFELDAGGHHIWHPIAPLARIDVDLAAPRLRWQGEAYLDHNRGSRPLAHDFESWQWSRARSGGSGSSVSSASSASAIPNDGHASIVYDAVARGGAARGLHLRIDAQGGLSSLPLPPPSPLPLTAWRLPRHGHRLGGAAPTLRATLESGPFYARSLLQQADGSLALHESLSLERFDNGWVQAMLPFRMPRRG